MLNSMKIGKRLLLGFGFMGLFLVAAVGLALVRMEHMSSDLRRIVTVYNQEQMQTAAMELQVQSVQRYLRTLIIAEDPGEIAANKGYIQEARRTYDEASRRLGALLISDRARAMYAQVGQLRDASRADSDAIVKLVEEGRKREAAAFLLGPARSRAKAWIGVMSDMSRFMEAQMEAAHRDAEEAHRGAQTFLTGITLLATLLGFIGATLITRSIVGPLRRFGDVMAQAAGGDLRVQAPVEGQDELSELGRNLNGMLGRLREALGVVSRGATSVASGAQELLATTDAMSVTTGRIAAGGDAIHGVTTQVASAMLQLSASVHQVAGNVKVSVDQSAAAVKATQAGAESGVRATRGMDRILETTSQIGKAVSVIQEIARQTNLLSLNAAIEAAKAGAHGRGFSVVAEEVRKLAERSRAAAVEIEGLIRGSDDVTKEGQESVRSTQELLGRIQDSIRTMAGMVLEIGTATEEQSRTAAEVSRRVEESAHAVGRNALSTQELKAMVAEITTASSELARISEGLAGSVAGFKV
ncbi:MAG TPA: methyl-accepting chemotaxis protein [Holophagaceae bacterium]|nr:methyl-accepting chemotaxis protein [Holophagaceae bacterium]